MNLMKTDRELLELAAKAVGYRLTWASDGSQAWLEYPDGVIGSRPNTDESWRPLTDDGDAFRLASKLNMTVEFGNNCVEFPLCVAGPGTDPLEATRRAIVLAAAEIGSEIIQDDDRKKQNT